MRAYSCRQSCTVHSETHTHTDLFVWLRFVRHSYHFSSLYMLPLSGCANVVATSWFNLQIHRFKTSAKYFEPNKRGEDGKRKTEWSVERMFRLNVSFMYQLSCIIVVCGFRRWRWLFSEIVSIWMESRIELKWDDVVFYFTSLWLV